jgi:hypothetical protein
VSDILGMVTLVHNPPKIRKHSEKKITFQRDNPVEEIHIVSRGFGVSPAESVAYCLRSARGA